MQARSLGRAVVLASVALAGAAAVSRAENAPAQSAKLIVGQPASPAAGPRVVVGQPATAGSPIVVAAARVPRTASERECLARAMYFESDKSSADGMLAVGTVVANRVKSSRYGSTFCGVVGQRGQFAPGVMSRSMTGAAADRARQMADAVLKGRRHPSAGDAMFFHVANMRFKYPNMHYVLVAGGNAFYEKRSAGAGNFASMSKAMAAAKRDETLAQPIVQAALEGRPAPAISVPTPVPSPLAYEGARSPAPGTALAAVAALRPKKGPRVVTPAEPVLAAAGPSMPYTHVAENDRFYSVEAPEANELVASAWAMYW